MRFLRHGLVVTLLASVCSCGVTDGKVSARKEGRQAATSSATATKDGSGATATADARELYLDSLRQQALQPSVSLVHEYYSQQKAYPGGSREAVVSGFDYRTKDVRLEQSHVVVADGKTEVAWATWCQGKSQNWFWSGPGHWSLTENQCPTLTDQAWVNDGLGVGGLTEKQADTFVSQLAGYEGLINARGKILVNRAGKQYIRLEIKVTPHSYNSGSSIGAGWYLNAFKYTELDANTHPYGLLGAESPALDIVRYIDPKTLLPVYSETQDTYGDRWHMHRVEYSFGGPVNSRPRPANPTDIPQMTWQSERR
ncbi:hypothetical protein OG417_05080 [Actinoallomurus sp. NBC_01490]|uniref:hypothetical protein n=1 Tax=Actinoallomurus sp. NBC_01490 TaxID=2903557 RepID=UPI002E2EC605|nr:hypothetical protein [Actinoallomurus sp. NBC_01490]